MSNENIHQQHLPSRLQLVAWEITRSCNLYCSHCRASAHKGKYVGELTTEECFCIVDQIEAIGKPILILSGGEPLMRDDVFEVGSYASQRGFRVVMGTNGTLITRDIAVRMREVPITRISVSIDFPTATAQDNFRGESGAYDAAVAGIKNAQAAGIEVQINCTVTRINVEYLPELVEQALELGAVAFHPFLLVPTGRGKGLADQELSPEDYESTLKWICAQQVKLGERLIFKPTDAPHYYRVAQQCGMSFTSHGQHPGNLNSMTRGCLAGTGFCFISHTGRVQGCGYLDIEAGDLRKNTFAEVWNQSELFLKLRDLSNLKGKCSACEFKRVCGGCRARAYEVTGDYLAAEPYCIYHPSAKAVAGHDWS